MQDACRYLEDLLHHDIPLTRTMQLRVESWQEQTLCLAMPLEPNINHTGSMFGGSLYSISVLAGWGWLTLRLREAGITDGHIVIKGGQLDYPAPMLGEARAFCAPPAVEDWDKFVAMYQRRGRSRLTLNIRTLTSDGTEALRWQGEYVLYR